MALTVAIPSTVRTSRHGVASVKVDISTFEGRDRAISAAARMTATGIQETLNSIEKAPDYAQRSVCVQEVKKTLESWLSIA